MTSGEFRTFAQLATLAAQQPVPDVAKLEFKEREDYTIIGSAVSGVDNRSIVTGGALFGIDTRVPDMVYAAYQKCPAIGGKVVSANVDEIKRLPGVDRRLHRQRQRRRDGTARRRRDRRHEHARGVQRQAEARRAVG